MPSLTPTMKIPLLLAVAAGAHITMTPPNPPPAEADQLKPTGFERAGAPRMFPLLLKVGRLAHGVVHGLFWTCGLTEVALLAADTTIVDSLSPHFVAQLRYYLDPTHGRGLRNLAFTSPFLIGTLLNVAGTALRLHCYARLRRFFTFELGVQAKQRLVTDGVYGIVRHPSYTGALAAGTGVALATLSRGSWVAECLLPAIFRDTKKPLTTIWVAGMTLACVGLRSRMIKEDRMLRDSFGQEWDEWAQRVNWWIVPGVY
ncbi:Protein-S-isoprenylcysteine O-methyltransferase [Mycena chlorophos]|uniref:Protein-S-isoprenylcysteine O-methyltransferase n=1 Tax=Mycena chlorophos TaxID=658473 RepID=A0A8H6S6R7_MYCCL|nr:Protein-S-isoprenylcysteine O-methyltransferase [Mycena chlorophos]